MTRDIASTAVADMVILTNTDKGACDVKRMATVILGVLLLATGIVSAAEKNTTQDPQVSSTAKELQKKLDLNRASRDELVGVPGIGPRMAQAIVDLRTKKGSFKKVEDLLEVTGIKEKKLASLSGYLEVIPVQTSASTTPAVQSR